MLAGVKLEVCKKKKNQPNLLLISASVVEVKLKREAACKKTNKKKLN